MRASNAVLDPQAIARKPTQQRSKDRFDQVLQEAEKLLNDEGLSGFSIPVLAERLGYTRGSVYAWFPTTYAILNELALRYLGELERLFLTRADQLAKLDWRESIETVVDLAVSFHNSHPAARLLILGGAVTDDSYRAQELTIKRLGELGRAIWMSKGLVLPTEPDVATVATDIGTACFRRSFFEHGTITPAYRDTAAAAMTRFLEPYVREAAVKTRR